MRSLYAPEYRSGCYIPVVHAYYDRADMVGTTYEMTGHAHTLCEMMYVESGSIAVEVLGQTVSLGRRQLIWLDASVRHRLILDREVNASVMNIEFQLEALPPRCPDFATLYHSDPALRDMVDQAAPYLVLSDRDDMVYNLLKQIIPLADSVHQEAEALCSWLTTQALLLVARGRAQAEPQAAASAHDMHLRQACAYIDAHCGETITVQQVAAALHVQAAYLHRLFREGMEQTMGAYITRQRIDRAQALLAETDDSLAQVALAVGISSPQRFAQLFRRLVGLTPSAYRSQSKQQGTNE